MKTYLITEINEPLKEGCLTQFGVLKSYSKDRFFNIEGQTYNCMSRDIWINELKHLKCYEVSEPLHWYGKDDYEWARKLEITDPSELQIIWEGIRYSQLPDARPEVHKPSIEEGIDRFQEWQNFTLEPGVHEVREPASVFDSIEVSEEVKKVVDDRFKVLGSDNNGWISVDKKLPEPGTEVLVWLRQVDDFDIDQISRTTTEEAFKRYYSHWQPLPQPPRP